MRALNGENEMGMTIKNTVVKNITVEIQKDTDMGDGEFHAYAHDDNEWVFIGSAQTKDDALKIAKSEVKNWN